MKDTQLLPLLTSSHPLSLFPFHTHASLIWILHLFSSENRFSWSQKVAHSKVERFLLCLAMRSIFNRFGLSEISFHKLTAWLDGGSMSRKGNTVCTNCSANTNCFITSTSSSQSFSICRNPVYEIIDGFPLNGVCFFFLLLCSMDNKPENWQLLSLLSDFYHKLWSLQALHSRLTYLCCPTRTPKHSFCSNVK